MELFRRLMRRLRGAVRKERLTRAEDLSIESQFLLAAKKPGTIIWSFDCNATSVLRRVLDFDALARTAVAIRKEPKSPRGLSLPVSSIGQYLRADVTRREASLLKGLLSLLGECYVEIPERRNSDGSIACGYVFVHIGPDLESDFETDDSWGIL